MQVGLVLLEEPQTENLLKTGFGELWFLGLLDLQLLDASSSLVMSSALFLACACMSVKGLARLFSQAIGDGRGFDTDLRSSP